MSKRRFIVMVEKSTEEEDQKLKAFIDEHGLSWWHWINNTWLLVDGNGKLTSEIIRDKLNEIHPNNTTMVLQLDFDSDTWSGWGPNKGERNMFKWLHDNWGK